MRQNFLAQYIQLLKCCLCDMHSGIVMENWTLSVDQCCLQALQFLVHLIDLLSILLSVEEGLSRSFMGWGRKPLVPSTCAGDLRKV